MQKLPRWYDMDIDYQCLRTLSKTLREAKWNVTVSVWQDKEVIDVQAGYHEDSYGAAVDIGSTTVALYLCNLRTGELLAAESEMNPQIVYGEDVMSRIQYAIEHPDGLEKLHKAIISTLNKLLKQAAKYSASIEEPIEILGNGPGWQFHHAPYLVESASERFGAGAVRACDPQISGYQSARVGIADQPVGEYPCAADDRILCRCGYERDDPCRRTAQAG